MDFATGDEASLAAYYATSEPQKKRGQKECPTCGVYLASASRECECGHSFYIVKQSKKSKKYKETDWQTVQSGDIIYVESSDVWISPEGVILPMGESGEYIVKKVTQVGLVLYSSRWGYSFQTMINSGYNEKTGITRGQTKIYVKKNVQK